MLYVNHTITIQPQKLDDYVKDFVDGLVPVMARYDIHPLGLWQTWGMNELIDVWEVKDNSYLDKLDNGIKEDKELRSYMQRALPLRLHWHVRLLRPTKFCPDLARIKQEKIKGGVYMWAVIPIDPFKIDEYLELFPQYGLKYEERYHLRTVGYWRGGGGEPTQSQAFYCTQLCVGDDCAFRQRFSEKGGNDPEVSPWLKRALNYRTHHTYSYLVPRWLPY